MQNVIQYIEQEVARRKAKGYTMVPWSLIPRNAAGNLVATGAVVTNIASNSAIIVTKALYQVDNPLPAVLPCLEGDLTLVGSPGYNIGRLFPTNIVNDGVNTYASLEWKGVSPLITGSIKPEYLFLAATLRFAKLEGWDIQFNY